MAILAWHLTKSTAFNEIQDPLVDVKKVILTKVAILKLLC